MALTDAPVRPSQSDHKAPPFRPDPEIMGNDEGNKRILERDRTAAKEFLEKQDEREH